MDAGHLRTFPPCGGTPVRVVEYAARSALDGMGTVTIGRARQKVIVRAYFGDRVRTAAIRCANDEDAHRAWDVLAHRADPDTVHALAWACASNEARTNPDEQ